VNRNCPAKAEAAVAPSGIPGKELISKPRIPFNLVCYNRILCIER
jgi:hypothetical protein